MINQKKFNKKEKQQTNFYKVESIIGVRLNEKSQIQYLVKWYGYQYNQSSWQSKQQLKYKFAQQILQFEIKAKFNVDSQCELYHSSYYTKIQNIHQNFQEKEKKLSQQQQDQMLVEEPLKKDKFQILLKQTQKGQFFEKQRIQKLKNLEMQYQKTKKMRINEKIADKLIQKHNLCQQKEIKNPIEDEIIPIRKPRKYYPSNTIFRKQQNDDSKVKPFYDQIKIYKILKEVKGFNEPLYLIQTNFGNYNIPKQTLRKCRPKLFEDYNASTIQ